MSDGPQSTSEESTAGTQWLIKTNRSDSRTTLGKTSHESFYAEDSTQQGNTGDEPPGQHHSTTQTRTAEVINQDQDQAEISTDWKTAIISMFVGSAGFMGAALCMFAYGVFFSDVFIFALAAFSLLWLVMRFSMSYYVYHDAKKLTMHARATRQSRWKDGTETWAPSPYIWAFLVLAMPPFVEYAPMSVYMFHRHRNIGVP